MKIKEGIIIQQLDNEYILIDSGVTKPVFQGMIKLNKVSKDIIEILQKEDLDKEGIINELSKKYSGKKEDIAKGVDYFIQELSKTVILIK